jgi:hypothetical protein
MILRIGLQRNSVWGLVLGSLYVYYCFDLLILMFMSCSILRLHIGTMGLGPVPRARQSVGRVGRQAGREGGRAGRSGMWARRSGGQTGRSGGLPQGVHVHYTCAYVSLHTALPSLPMHPPSPWQDGEVRRT